MASGRRPRNKSASFTGEFAPTPRRGQEIPKGPRSETGPELITDPALNSPRARGAIIEPVREDPRARELTIEDLVCWVVH